MSQRNVDDDAEAAETRAVVIAAQLYRNAINGVTGSLEPEDAWLLLDAALQLYEADQ